MKKQLFLTVVAFLLIGLNAFSQTGDTCTDPVIVTNLPYQISGDTANNGDEFDSIQGNFCGATPLSTNYLEGNDVFYSYTATFSGELSITMSPTAGNSSIFVYDNCPSAGTPCLTGQANTSTTTRSLTISVTAGQTYIVVISSSATVQSIGYTLTLQRHDCSPAPVSLNVSNITAATATLSWSSNNFNSWQVALQPAGASIPVENGQYTISQTSLFLTNLNAGAPYQFWVRAECSANSGLYTDWAGPYVFNTTICEPADKCTYKFVMTDSGASGWNGGRMQVRQNGIVIQTIGQTITGGGPTTVNVSLCTNIPFELYWSVPGTAPEEIGVSIQNPFTDIIYTKLPGEGSPLQVLYNNVTNCTPPSCPKPTGLGIVANSTTQTSVQLSWTESGNAGQWEVYAVPSGGPAPMNDSPVTGTGVYHIANSNPYTLTGLEPQTNYDYYVRSVCSDTNVSTWPIVNPGTFTTKPLNDECPGAITVPVNLNRDCTAFASGSTLGATRSLPGTNPECPGNTDDDVWFSFQATSTTHIITLSDIVSTVPTASDLNHTLYAGNGCTALSQLYCSNPNVSIATNLIIGNYYKIRVYTNFGNISQSAAFKLCITTPDPVTNDECSTATLVQVSNNIECSNSVHGSITGATPSPQPSTCSGSEDDDVWFKFVATNPFMLISLNNITGTTENLVFSLFQGDCDNLNLVYCSEPDTNIAENLVVGQTYYIRVWSSVSTLQDIIFDLCITRATTPLTISTTQYTTAQLVSNVLINNPCVDISNVTSSTGTNFGSVNGIGYFLNTNDNTYFPIHEGLLLTTGDALHASGHNTYTLSEGIDEWLGDTQLEDATFMDSESHNASILEFDFTTPTAYMSFNFLFASEEYGSFQCNYSDAFAFLLTDLVNGTTTNLAVLSDSTPISVINIRDQAYNEFCSSEHPELFGHFFEEESTEILSAVNFNGQTQILTASSAILPNHPYHIKLVIADRQDNAFDSAVFIQAGSFASGPPECTDKIKLVSFVDENANGIKEATEAAFTFGTFSYQQNNAGDVSHISTPLGTYIVYDSNPANTYDFSYTIDPEYQAYFGATATNFNDINIAVGSGTTELFFPVNVIQPYNNLAVSILPTGTPRPGFDYTNTVVYTNLGMTATSGSINFSRDASTAIIDVSQPGTVATTDGFSYNFINLLPHETRTFTVTMSVPNIPLVNLGDQLTTSAVISVPTGDIDITDNTYSNIQTVVGAYDPNDKQEAHGGKINFNQFTADDYLYYTVRFQNTGTYNAMNVRVEDILDGQLDPESIRMVSASHNYVMERVDNKVIWYFDYIQLPSMFQNEALSHGYITFRIKPLPGFEVGDIISNTADIYFDTNPPITTNTVNTIFEIPLGIGVLDPSQILLFPNPASQYIRVALVNTSEDMAGINITDMLGKSIIVQENINSKQVDLNISHLAKGVYLVEIVTANRLKQIKKLVIQ